MARKIKPNYTYKKTAKGNIIASNGEYEIKIYTEPYKMATDCIDFDDVDFEKVGIDEFVEGEMTFFDGYAVDENHQVLLVYKTLKELMADPYTEWANADFYDDGSVNFYQIQYEWQTDIKAGKVEVEEWLKEHTNDLAEKTYEVSAPMFVLPFIKVKADNEEQAKAIYEKMVTDALEKAFGEVDVRPLHDKDETDAWKVELAE